MTFVENVIIMIFSSTLVEHKSEEIKKFFFLLVSLRLMLYFTKRKFFIFQNEAFFVLIFHIWRGKCVEREENLHLFGRMKEKFFRIQIMLARLEIITRQSSHSNIEF